MPPACSASVTKLHPDCFHTGLAPTPALQPAPLLWPAWRQSPCVQSSNALLNSNLTQQALLASAASFNL